MLRRKFIFANLSAKEETLEGVLCKRSRFVSRILMALKGKEKKLQRTRLLAPRAQSELFSGSVYLGVLKSI